MKINITEEEKRNILKMHKSLMLEQVQTTNTNQVNWVAAGTPSEQKCGKNMDYVLKTLEKELKDSAFGNVNVRNLRITTQPNPDASQFGSITFDYHHDGNLKSVFEETISCKSKIGDQFDMSYVIVYEDTRRPMKGTRGSINGYKKIYEKMCERINSCVNFYNQQS